MKRKIRGMALAVALSVLGTALAPSAVQAKNEWVTVPVILGDYYVWSYLQAIEDKADIYGFSTAGVDVLGWSLVLMRDPAGLFFVNLAGLAKTGYPIVTLLASSDEPTRERAWVSLGTHAATLLTLEFLGHPGLSLNSSMGPRQDGVGGVLALRF
jgi:hypothetical protein